MFTELKKTKQNKNKEKKTHFVVCIGTDKSGPANAGIQTKHFCLGAQTAPNETFTLSK